MLIYIIGRGKSGSTILDIALSQSKDIVGMGELLSGLGRKKTCTCGLKAKDCKEWRALYNGNLSVSKTRMNYIKSESKITHFFKYFFSSKNWFFNKAGKYLKINEEILKARNKNSSGSILVDSSKEITRGLILSRGKKDTVFIHLIRDPYKVISSNMHRVEDDTGYKFMRKTYKNKSARPIFFLITAIGWVLGNIFCELTKFYSKKRSIRIRFEDICFHPNETVGKIEKLAGTELQETKRFLNGESAAKKKHLMGGNRTNREDNLVFDRDRALGRENLSKSEKLIAILITGGLRKIYGY